VEREAKPDGSFREKYDTNEPLKSLLQAINSRFLKRCDYPDYLTGSLKGWSYLKNAQLHAGQGTIISIDATNFFPSISQSSVKDIWFNLLQFEETAAETLSKLCTRRGFLAQGAPPSSFLANLAFWDIEPLIVAQLRSQGFKYSRYVDDIVVSHERHLTRVQKTGAIKAAQKVFLSKGLKIKTRKTKVADRNRCQTVTGLNVNSGRARLPKKKQRLLRASVYRFVKDSAGEMGTYQERLTRFRSLEGKILSLRQTGSKVADQLLKSLRTARPTKAE
tara:strand:- start:12378 stop:13205 length:828 start_codon:yes stop_codon:yes gene_type:complete